MPGNNSQQQQLHQLQYIAIESFCSVLLNMTVIWFLELLPGFNSILFSVIISNCEWIIVVLKKKPKTKQTNLMPEMFPLNYNLSQICCYSDNRIATDSPDSSHSPTLQRGPSPWSPLLLLRWWRPTLHLLHSHYCHTSLHSDPLPDRNKVMDRTSFNWPMKKQT